jgi:hypothetical protein
LIDSKHLNGYLAEQKAALYYSKLGYIIYWPNHSQSPCDFIACKEDDLIRVQVKSPYWMIRSTGCEYLQCTIRKGAKKDSYYTKKECDVILAAYENRIWIIPIEDIGNNTNIIVDRKQEIRRSHAKDWSHYEVK